MDTVGLVARFVIGVALAVPLALWLAVTAHDALRHACRRRARTGLRVLRGRG